MLRRLMRQESGAGMVEYTLLTTLLVIVILAGIRSFGLKAAQSMSDSTQASFGTP